jgi:hypothetical protein
MLISLLFLPLVIQAHKARQQRQRDAMALNVLSGDYEGHPVTLFDFHYATRGVWWWAPSWKIHNYASFVILHLNKEFPELTIGAEGRGLFKMISDAFGGGDIDFESHEFSERYEVRSKNKKFADAELSVQRQCKRLCVPAD